MALKTFFKIWLLDKVEDSPLRLHETIVQSISALMLTYNYFFNAKVLEYHEPKSQKFFNSKY